MRLYEIENLRPGSNVTTLQAKGSGGTTDPEKMQNLFKRMESKCSQIIQIYLKYYKNYGGYKYFKRGSSKSQNILSYYGRSHEERKPKDTDFQDHALVVETMKKAGFKAHRGNSIFMRNGSVGSYGTSFIVFPVDGFNYAFSEKIVDLYSTFLRIPDIKNTLKSEFNNPNALKEYYTEQLGYEQNINLFDALVLSKDPEVMVSGYYFALNERYMEEEVNKWLETLA